MASIVLPSSSTWTGEQSRELTDMLDVAQRQPREHTNADRMNLLEHRRGLDSPINVKPVDEVGERLGVADLLDGEDIGAKPVNHTASAASLASLGTGVEVGDLLGGEEVGQLVSGNVWLGISPRRAASSTVMRTRRSSSSGCWG